MTTIQQLQKIPPKNNVITGEENTRPFEWFTSPLFM